MSNVHNYEMENNFTSKDKSDKIKGVNGHRGLTNLIPELSRGYNTKSEYNNKKQNNVKPWQTKEPELSMPKESFNKFEIPKEKLEQERLKRITGEWNLKKVKQQDLNNHIRLRNKRSDNYYKEIVDDKEQEKRLNEAMGPKTDFSLSNYVNNYDKFNQEEKEIFVHKMQLEFNRSGYTGKDGYKLKTDGILGKNTKKALDDYKKRNQDDYKEAVKINENINKGSGHLEIEKLIPQELVYKGNKEKIISVKSDGYSKPLASFREMWDAVWAAGPFDSKKNK